MPSEAAVAAGTMISGTKNVPTPMATAPATVAAPIARFLTKWDSVCGC